jgi:hypothetical protein
MDHEDTYGPGSAGKYVTHGDVSKEQVLKVLKGDNDLKPGENSLEYDGKKMEVDLVVNRDWMVFFYDDAFEEHFEDERFEQVLTYFLTPTKYKHHSDIHPENR